MSLPAGAADAKTARRGPPMRMTRGSGRRAGRKTARETADSASLIGGRKREGPGEVVAGAWQPRFVPWGVRVEATKHYDKVSRRRFHDKKKSAHAARASTSGGGDVGLP